MQQHGQGTTVQQSTGVALLLLLLLLLSDQVLMLTSLLPLPLPFALASTLTALHNCCKGRNSIML